MLPEIESFHNWLRRKQPRSATALHYTSDLKLFFQWANKPPGAVTLRDVDAYIEHGLAQHHANATVNRRLVALHTFYEFLAVEQDNAPLNPVLPRRHYIPRGRRLPRDVEDAQITRLFALITHPRDRAMFLLMLRCGLRVGEVQALTLSDLSLQPGAGELPRLLVHGKGGYERIAYLCPQVLAELEFWLLVRRRDAGDGVFLGRDGERLLVNGIQRCLSRYCRRAGLWITCHQLRHVFARHMLQARMPVTSLQKLLGHARLRSTQSYIHVSDPNVQADYVAAMERVLALLETPGGAA